MISMCVCVIIWPTLDAIMSKTTTNGLIIKEETYWHTILQQNIVIRINLMHLETLVPVTIRKLHFISRPQGYICREETQLKFDIGLN